MKVYNKSCLFLKEDISKSSVDLVVTSPPYKDEDGYSDSMIREIASLLFWSMKNKSLAFVNFGHLAGKKSRPFHVVAAFESAGFNFIDSIIWVKSSQFTGGHYTPINSPYLLNNMYEYIFLFGKGKKIYIDRLSIGIPYLDKSNIKRYGKKDLRCAGNVWYVGYPTVQSKEDKPHKDMFPEEIPRRCIKISGIKEGSLVLDPFMGSGTTGRAAEKAKMQCIGYETNKKYFEQYEA